MERSEVPIEAAGSSMDQVLLLLSDENETPMHSNDQHVLIKSLDLMADKRQAVHTMDRTIPPNIKDILCDESPYLIELASTKHHNTSHFYVAKNIIVEEAQAGRDSSRKQGALRFILRHADERIRECGGDSNGVLSIYAAIIKSGKLQHEVELYLLSEIVRQLPDRVHGGALDALNISAALAPRGSEIERQAVAAWERRIGKKVAEEGLEAALTSVTSMSQLIERSHCGKGQCLPFGRPIPFGGLFAESVSYHRNHLAQLKKAAQRRPESRPLRASDDQHLPPNVLRFTPRSPQP